MEALVSAFLASLESEPAYSKSTRLAYASDLRVFLSYLQQTLHRSPQVTDLNGRIIAEFLNSESRAGRHQNTLARRWATLRQYTAFLHQEGVLASNPLAADSYLIHQAISSGSPNSRPRCLTEAEVASLLAAMDASPRPRARRDQAILTLLLETGLSVGMLVELDLPDLDLHSGKIHLTPESGQGLWLPLGKATEALTRYLRAGRPELSPQPDEPALFVSQMGERMSRQGIWQILRHWGNRSDPPLEVSPRLVRHTAVLNMARNGRSLAEIQTLLGHSNPISTHALLRRLKA